MRDVPLTEGLGLGLEKRMQPAFDDDLTRHDAKRTDFGFIGARLESFADVEMNSPIGELAMQQGSQALEERR